MNYFCEAGDVLFVYFFLKFEKNLLIIAAATPKTKAKTIENIPYRIGTFIDKSLTNCANGSND